MIRYLIFFIALLSPVLIQAEENSDNKTVLLAILARDKAHILPLFLNCIENLDYNKNLISLYINTNNNVDNTQEILEEWAKKNESQYKRIIFDSHHLSNIEATSPHQWTVERFKILAAIRNKSLEKAKEEKTDFYFVIDCDNFITPCTLKELIHKDKPIIAPMLRSIPNYEDAYSNFFAATCERGYYVPHPDYEKIRNHVMVGTFKVPVVHCTYLIKSDYLDCLNYMDGTDDYEFAIFSRIARQNNVDQYICNEKNFGLLLHFFDEPSLEEEIQRVKGKKFQLALLELKVTYSYPISARARVPDSKEQAKWYCLLKGYLFSPLPYLK